MSKLQQYLSDLKTHQEEEIEIQIDQPNKPENSDDSDDEQNEILNEILKCMQKGLSERVFDFDITNQIRLIDVDDMNKSALYLDALAWLYSNRVDRTYVESLKLKVNLLRAYDTTTVPNVAPQKKSKQQQQPQQVTQKTIHLNRNVELKEITKYGESTLDFKPYTHQYDTLQINPFFNQTSKSLDMQDLNTLIIYNPQFDENLAIIIDPDQLLKVNEQNKNILTGFIKLEIDTSVLDYSNLVSKQFKMSFNEINDFRERYKYLLNKKDTQSAKLEKSQQIAIDKFINDFRVYDEKLKQAQQTIDQQQQSLSQLSVEEQQFISLNQQYQQQLRINPTEIDTDQQDLLLRNKIAQLNIDSGPSQGDNLNQTRNQQGSVQNLVQQINQMDVEEFNNQLPELLPDPFDEDQLNENNKLQLTEEQRQLQLEQFKINQEKNKILREQFQKQQKETAEKQAQIQEELKQLSYQQQFQDIFNDVNAPIDEWDLEQEEEFDQDLAPYEEQQQIQKTNNQQQVVQQQQTNVKKKQKKVYPDTFNFDDAAELNRFLILNTVGNTQRDFGQRELTLKCLADNCQDFDYYRYFEYFTREYTGFLEEEEHQQAVPIAGPENFGLDEIQIQVQLEETNYMIENYQNDLEYYILPFRVQANNNNEPITIKQLQVILERVIDEIKGQVEFIKIEKTMPLIINEKISKSKLFAALLFVAKNKGYKLEQKNNSFNDILIIKKEQSNTIELDNEEYNRNESQVNEAMQIER
ncbi:unnamed protein product (macronuclear) [Paramecium tetraurelia]|uniref:Condensin-2 complex subunit H2 C-terminal domain-containing protein n=1 Tax=Paramecium tetraurelia TaxID=5888 RepID=A0CSM4_PARTE|nr:uncharacterized protein GSPATT00010063001 [Paramecium tetraurelia]CAK73791.1 unnamed protein product [Paramecium tetraurelia]|eukprot:XP_001441188.1 hypothetical protein (macronuclear) [Paramecium tetraurelia strain d4-2]